MTKIIKCVIDSINLKNYTFESIFDELYIIEEIKTIGVFTPDRWREEFGKKPTSNLIEAKIVHVNNGSVIPLKRYSNSKEKQVIEFAGINGYTNKSYLLKNTFMDLKRKIEDSIISRIDIAFDMEKIPLSIIKELSEKRIPFQYKNTTYFKTKKEKKTNQQIDIKYYNKAKRDKLSYSLERIEFCFKGQYFNNIKLKNIESALVKIKKGIKRFIGIAVEIEPL